MAKTESSEDATNRGNAVCPESSPNSCYPADAAKKENKSVNGGQNISTCPESTIESAPRRDFIKKAAMATTAVAIGGTLLGKGIIPESSAANKASPNTTCTYGTFCELCVYDWSEVDAGNHCNGNPYYFNAIRFGSCKSDIFGSGEKIGSQRNCCTYTYDSCHFLPGHNLFGLDFYTNHLKRMSITNSGRVGIGLEVLGSSATPSSTLEVIGSFSYCSCHPPPCFAPVLSATNTAKSDFCTNCCPQIYAGAGVLGSSCCGVGVVGHSGGCIGVIGKGFNGGVYGQALGGPDAAGVSGHSPNASGVYGTTNSCICNGAAGVFGCVGPCVAGNTVGVYGRVWSGKGIGVVGTNFSCKGGIGVEGLATTPKTVPLVAKGAYEQTSDLQQWQAVQLVGCTFTSVVKSVVNKCGWLGIGTANPQTTLQVKGGMSLGIKNEALCTCYSMNATCFAILANPSTTGKNVTLPAANNAGMMVYIKNISANSVTVKAAGSDHIENSSTTTYPLSSQQSVTMIASGGSPGTWYVIFSAT